MKFDDMLVASAGTWTPPTMQQCEEKIRLAMVTYVTKKWWQPKKYLLEDAIRWATTYQLLEQYYLNKKQNETL